MTSPLQALWEPVEDVNEYGFGANAPVPDDVATNPPHRTTDAHPLAAAHAHANLPSDARIVIPVVVGTRPEAIKLVPVILALRESEYYEPLVVSTGQHARMVSYIFDLVGIKPDVTLWSGARHANLNARVASVMERFEDFCTERFGVRPRRHAQRRRTSSPVASRPRSSCTATPARRWPRRCRRSTCASR